MTRAFLKNLHPDDYQLWLAVEKAAWRLAFAANLPLTQVRPMPRRMVTGIAGYYITPPDAKDKEIWISLRTMCKVKRGGTDWGKRHSLHYLLDTITHEMAHCKVGCGADHGPRFSRAHAEMMVLAEDIKLRLDLKAFDGKLEP